MAKSLVIKIQADADKASKDIKGLSSDIDKLTKENKKFGATSKQVDAVNGKFKALAVTITGIAAAYLSFEGAKKIVSTTADLEKGFIGVAKTTGLAGEELDKLKDDILNLSTSLAGVSIEGLQSVAETAGQLGIKGSANILKFTEVIAKMGAATDLTAEEAAVAMAKMGNSLGVPIDKFENLGSVINELSNNTTATARDLVEVGQRIAGVGKSFGLTASEVLGLSATLKDVGLTSEVAGTAISEVMLKMLTDTEAFAKASGLSFEDFSTKLKDKPVEALEAFLAALGKLDKTAKIKVLDDLKMTGAGVAQTILKLSDNTDKLATNLSLAGDEWKRNTSLQKEYDTAAQGLDAQWERAKNAIMKLSYEIGEKLLPKLKELIDQFVKWMDGLDDAKIQEFANDIADMVGAFADVGVVLGQFVAGIGSVIALSPKLFAGILGVVGVLKIMNGLLPGVSAGLISMGASTTAVAGASVKSTGAVSGLVGALKSAISLAGPWGIAFAAMAVAANVAIDAYVDGQQKANAATNATSQELNTHSEKMQSISDLYTTASNQIREYGSVSVTTREAIRQALEAEKLSLEASIAKLEQNKTMTEGQTTAYFNMAKSLGTVKASLDTLDTVYTVDMELDINKLETEKNKIEKEPVDIKIESDTEKWANEYNKKLAELQGKPLEVALKADSKELDAAVAKAKLPTDSTHTFDPNATAVLSTINQIKQPTSSVHTIYERVVSQRANGGLIPQRLAVGGTFTGSGKVPGYDATDSDKVNALLTGGEYVIKRSAVDKYGVGLLSAINGMKVPKFSTGGSVTGKQEAIVSTATQPINLNIGGQTFPVMGDREVAEALQRFINSEGGF